MDYETEEQQLEAIKKWWHENSTTLIAGLAVGVSAIFGWQYYQQKTALHVQEASVIYENLVTASVSNDQINEQQARTNQLVAEYADTPYASLSSMIMAKQFINSGEAAKAQQQLQWVIENTDQDELKFLAKIRLSRVLLGAGQVDQALMLVNEDYPESFKGIVLELKGDILVSQEKPQQARDAYQSALEFSSSNQLIQLKIDDLGLTQQQSTDTTEPSA